MLLLFQKAKLKKDPGLDISMNGYISLISETCKAVVGLSTLMFVFQLIIHCDIHFISDQTTLPVWDGLFPATIVS